MITQTATMLKFTPTFHHPPSSIIKKPHTHFTNFPNINITTNRSFHITSFPKICMTNNKPFHISSCSKKDINSVSKDAANSTLTTSEKLQLHVFSAFEAILSTDQKNPYRFIKENDQILFRHNGKEIVRVFQHVVHHGDYGLFKMTIQTELGLLENLKISGTDVYNHTFLDEEGKDKMWSISTTLECKEGDVEKMKKEIKDIQNANHELKYNHVLVNSYYPSEIKFDVGSRVTVSKLKTPHFEHYMELRRKVFSEIDEIRIKHGGSLERIEFEVLFP
ncbi:hypothetical protein MKW92_015420 [Papaver armeniacum]|nr:hypothetical protein MKW92_015420 [Papaver armeniacum]